MEEKVRRTLEENSKHRFVIGVGIFVLIFVVLAARRPDTILRAQFWAEDGQIWYADAYHLGFLHALMLPHTGYFQTIARLVVGSSVFVPLAYAPLYSNTIALAIRAVIICFFLSRRFDFIAWVPRLFIVIYYCIMPDIDELHINMTNTYWYMGLYALLIFIAKPAQKKWEWVHDCVVIFIAVLSGLLPVFLLPFIGLKYLCQTDRNEWFNWCNLGKFLANPVYIALYIGALVQLSHLDMGERAGSTLGATLTRFVQIISSRFLMGIFGRHFADLPWQSAVSAYCIASVLLILFILVLTSKNWRLITVVLFPMIVVAMALYKPVITADNEQWKYLRIMDAAQRYFFLFHICIFGAIAVALYHKCRSSLTREVYRMAFATWFGLLAGRYHHIAPIPDQHWRESVKRYEQAEVGQKIDMPIAPRGWIMTLTKKHP